MSFTFNLNCFRECSIKKLFCCRHNKKKYDNIFKPIEKFKVSELQDIDELTSIFYKKQLLIMTAILNPDGDIISFTKNNGDININYTIDDDIKNKIGINFYLLLQDINSKVFNRKNIVGCKLTYENYDYEVIGMPLNNEGEILCNVIIKRLKFF